VRPQRGAALMILLLIAGVLGAFFAMHALNSNTERDKVTAAVLAQAKDALLGYAVTYRDNHANEMFGYLPCPDIDNATATPGQADADAACSGKDISTLRRLPWSTLGLPPLRDSAGECLWYGVSGHAKANTDKTEFFNWDSLGQFVLQDANGSALHGASPHDRPLAVIFAPRGSINTISRAGPATECQGSNTIAAYLDGDKDTHPIYAGTVPDADALSTLVLSTKASVNSGSNNDQATWITSKEVFDRLKKRSDFKADIDAMIGGLATCLNNLPPSSLPGASAGNKGIDNIIAACPALGALKIKVLANWKDNLLYTKPTTPSTVNSNTGCSAVLLFGGERIGIQSRATADEKQDKNMYLEGGNATLFPGSGAYTGATGFTSASASSDIVVCIKSGTPSSGNQVSFAADFDSFTSVGTGVTPSVANQSVSIGNATGASGGCFWSPTLIPLAGKTLRAYYDFKFLFSDASSDRGNGFTLSLVRGDIPKSFPSDMRLIPPATCGKETTMGALKADNEWGVNSIIIETDVHRNAGNSDPTENHTAIMLNGNLDHKGPGDTMSTACNGSATGCQHTPKNYFEESPLLPHNQRVEIHTGCNAGCSACSPANHVAPNTYAKISTWTDCQDCNDVVVDLVGTELITASANRDFSAPANWSGVNWSVAASALVHTAGGTAATLPNTALNNAPVSGTTYQLTFTVTTTAAGSLTMTFGGKAAVIPLAIGTLTSQSVQLTATSSANLTVTPNAAWAGSIDNLSITTAKTPTVARCMPLDPSMNSIFFGITGGFSNSAKQQQGVTLDNLILRSE
jgi:hypothetical protein